MALPNPKKKISFKDIINNINDNTATPSDPINIKSMAGIMSGASIVGDIDGSGTGNTSDDRDLLNEAPYGILEFADANYPNDIFSNVVAKDSTGTSVMDNGYIDGETARIYWDIETGGTDNYTAGLKYATDNSIVVSATLDDDGNNKTVYKEVTVPSTINATDDVYYPFVSTGTYSNAIGANINHYDALSTLSINDPSNRTVATDTTTATETHTATIGDASSVSDYAWTFAKDGTVSADGGNPSPTTSTTASPTVTYTGPGRYTSVLTVKGGKSVAGTTSTAVANRNSLTSTAQSFDIEYTDAVTISTPNDTNEGSVGVSGTHLGLAGGVKIGVHDGESTWIADDTTDTTNTKFEAASAIVKTVTVTATNTTRTLYARIEDKADATTAANSNSFKVYPDVSTEFASGDISISPNPAIVGQNVTLSVGNVTDNITGYAWAMTSGTGTMTSTNATGGGAGDSTATIINEQTAVTNTVVFNTAQSSKTVRLTLNARLSQTDNADATLSVELADAVSIDNIKNSTGTATVTAINGGAGVRLTGTAAGQQYGSYFGLVTSTAATTFLTSGTYAVQTDTTDSRYAVDTWASTTITPTDERTTRTIQGRVVDRTSTGTAGSGETDNSDSITVYPTLNSTRNVINPNTTQTIYSTTNNTDTSTYGTSFSFSAPSSTNNTDNVTGYSYTETSTALTISNATTATATVVATSGVGANQTVRLTVSGTGASGTQTSYTEVGVNVYYMPKPLTLTTNAGTGTGTIYNEYNISATWQGFAIEDGNDKVVLQLFNNATSTQVGSDVEYTGTSTAVNPDGSVVTAGTFGVSNQQFNTFFSSLNAAGTYLLKGKFYSNSSQVGNTLTTGTFSLTKPQQINLVSVFDEDEGGGGGNAFWGGFRNRIDAVNQDESNSGADTPITDNSTPYVADLTFDNGEKFSTDANLATNFNGFGSGNSTENWYSHLNYVFQIATNGDISNSRSRTPDVPSAPTDSSTSTTDLTVGIAANTLVTEQFQLHVSPTINSTNTSTLFSATSQATSHTQTQSIKAVFSNTNLASNTTYTIKVRAKNGYAYSAYSTTATITTDSISTSWSMPSNFSDEVMHGTSTSGNHAMTLSNGTGNSTFTFVKLSGDTLFNEQFAVGTSTNPTNWSNPGTTITLSHNSSYQLKVRHDFKEAFLGNEAVYRVTATNNGVSGTVDITFTIEGD